MSDIPDLEAELGSEWGEEGRVLQGEEDGEEGSGCVGCVKGGEEVDF